MDTRLKKTHKLTTLIITLVVLIPALILTALYPRMEEAANQKRKEYESSNDHYPVEESFWTIQENFPSFIVEATYCMYANHLMDTGGEVNRGALEEYGWTNDYFEVLNNTEYLVNFGSSAEGSLDSLDLEEIQDALTGIQDVSNLLEERELLACLEIVYNKDGDISKVQVYTTEDVNYFGNARAQAEESQAQYVQNVRTYAENRGEDISASTLVPKNMKALFVIGEDSSFVFEEWEPTGYRYTSTPTLYMDTGALAAVIMMAVMVALFALLLPFIKRLETGWEKPFNLPFEVMLLMMAAGIGGAVFMYEAMCFTSMHELSQLFPGLVVSFLGFAISIRTLYYLLLALNFLGWALLFWMEYMVVASFRQFLCRPKYYLKNRILCVRGIRWCVGKAKQFWQKLTNYELSQNLHKKLIILVLINTGIVTLMCAGWLVGIVVNIAYAIVIYLFLRKQMEKVQKDYSTVKESVHQMAEGNLKHKGPADLGAFQSLGDELSLVKEGFAKAVAEEAKSQSMKTELITNVSHDLKTPLTAIITYVDLLGNEGITEEERKSYLDTLDKKSQRLKVLIEDLFEISKAQSGNVKMNPMHVDVVNLMKQVRTEMDDKIADSDLSFRWNLPEEKVILYLDGQKTFRVFENLLNNILKYSMPHSRVYVDILADDAQVQIMFRNISSVELDFDAEHLTDRFVRGDASRTSEGSGLGLAIAKSFVELQGGSFQIDVDGDLFKVVLRWNK